MCKLVYIKVRDGTAYSRSLKMLRHQENVVAGHSTGITFRTSSGFSTRKSIGKVNSFVVKYPDQPASNEVLAHSRYATVGKITTNNQPPISVMLKDKKIGYGIHNGTFTDFPDYEHYRSASMVNKTDSVLLFTLFSKALEEMGDSTNNRKRAFAYIMSLIKENGNHNLIMMFKNGLVLFSGNSLTYNAVDDKVGIMSFGLQIPVDDGYVYSVNGFDVQKYEIEAPRIRSIIRRPKPRPNTVQPRWGC